MHCSRLTDHTSPTEYIRAGEREMLEKHWSNKNVHVPKMQHKTSKIFWRNILSLCVLVSLSLCPFVPLSLCPFVRLSLCPFVPLSLWPSVPLSLNEGEAAKVWSQETNVGRSVRTNENWKVRCRPAPLGSLYSQKRRFFYARHSNEDSFNN